MREFFFISHSSHISSELHGDSLSAAENHRFHFSRLYLALFEASIDVFAGIFMDRQLQVVIDFVGLSTACPTTPKGIFAPYLSFLDGNLSPLCIV